MPEPVTFFDHQDQAKRRARWALAGFALTVTAVVVSVAALAGLTYVYGLADDPADTRPEVLHTVWLAAAGVTLAIVLGSWLIRRWSLAGGPHAVMESMGGRRIAPDAADAGERQLLNLVEEMSIASGLPVPDVYVLDSNAINACAAGLQTDKAAVAVTRGALLRLDRDELQGIIAHEFSHILHGDMALNTQLIAWLAGLFTVGEIGRWMIYINFGGGSRRRGKNDRGSPQIALLGAGIWLAGSLGVLFGKILQARLSREREFLADASAVQYTRNPRGIGNALRKLGHKGVRGRMAQPHSDCAHMMLSPLRSSSFTRMFATHPPMPARVRRVLPEWDGTWLDSPHPEPSVYHPAAPSSSSPSPASQAFPQPVKSALLIGLLDRLHVPAQERVQAVEAWRDSLPKAYLEAARHPEDAPALVYHLLLPGNRDIPAALEDKLPARLRDRLRDLRKQPPPSTRDRLPLLDLALPALRQMPEAHKAPFLKRMEELIQADGQVDLFEYALRRIVMNTLEAGNGHAPSRRRLHVGKALPSLNIMFSVLSRIGAEEEADVQTAFQKARDYMLGFTAGGHLELLPPEKCRLADMDRACHRLADLTPKLQERAMAAGLAAISADERLTDQEIEAYRAFAAALHVPAPPHLGFGA